MATSATLLIVVTGEPTEDVAAHDGDFPSIIARALGDHWRGGFRTVDARREDLALAAMGADAMVITGSAAHVHQREPWVLRTEAWLRAEVPKQRPILGLCFGHQLLASALGGEVRTNPAGREMGTVGLERLGEDPIFAGISHQFRANTCHLDTVTVPPPGAVVLARSERDRHQCLRFAPRCYGVQFHPEFDGSVMRGYLRARREALAAEGHDPDAMLREAADTPNAARLLANFALSIVT